jgi:hypothetical protein
MNRLRTCVLSAALALAAAALPTAGHASLLNPDTDWMSGRYGIGFHYIQNWMAATKDGGPVEWNAAVNSFDVNRFASEAESTGAKWVLFTVGQNSGYYTAPCAYMNSKSGYAPGERCSNRDLLMDMANALNARGLKLIVYVPANAPKSDARIANGFGLFTKDSNGNWHMNATSAQQWSGVMREWSLRYGPRVAGWWYDGFYGANGFVSSWGPYYSDASKAGNPDSIIALNGGASSFDRRSEAQDYIAGESGSLTKDCTSRWLQDVHCHTFITLGSWGGADPIKYTDDQVVTQTNDNLRVGAGMTWNIGVSSAGAIKSTHLAIFQRIRSRLIGSGTPGPTPTPAPTATPGPTPTPAPTSTPGPTPTPGGFNGYYRITPRHSGKAVAVQSASTANSANVFQWSYGGTNTNDEWQLLGIGSGYYRVIARHSGKDMVVASASTAEGANIFQYAYGGTTTNDEWAVVDVGSGYFRITNRNSGKSAEVTAGGTADGADVAQRTYSGAMHQQFQLVSVP